MIVVLQVSIDPSIPKNRTLNRDELLEIYGKLSTLCSGLEKYGYISAQMYIDDKAYTA